MLCWHKFGESESVPKTVFLVVVVAAILHFVLFVVAMLSIGSASILVRLSMASGTACAFWRLAISSVFLLIVGLRNREQRRPAVVSGVCRRGKALHLTLAGGSLAAHFILWMDSLFRVPVAVSVTLVVVYPIYLALVELFQEKKLHLVAILTGLVVGFTGVVLLFREALISKKLDVVGVLESAVAAILAAVYFYVGKVLRQSMDLRSYALAVYSKASLVVLVYSLIVGDNVFSYLPRSWHWFVLLALIPMLGGHTVMNYLLKFYRSATVTSIALAEPIIATVLAAAILNEKIEPIHMLSMALVLSGVAITIAVEMAEKQGVFRV